MLSEFSELLKSCLYLVIARFCWFVYSCLGKHNFEVFLHDWITYFYCMSLCHRQKTKTSVVFVNYNSDYYFALYRYIGRIGTNSKFKIFILSKLWALMKCQTTASHPRRTGNKFGNCSFKKIVTQINNCGNADPCIQP